MQVDLGFAEPVPMVWAADAGHHELLVIVAAVANSRRVNVRLMAVVYEQKWTAAAFVLAIVEAQPFAYYWLRIRVHV